MPFTLLDGRTRNDKTNMNETLETLMTTLDTKPMLHTDHLEQLIDCYGLPRLLAELAEIAYAKAEHVQTNWQDTALASQWTSIGGKLAKLGHNIPRL